MTTTTEQPTMKIKQIPWPTPDQRLPKCIDDEIKSKLKSMQWMLEPERMRAGFACDVAVEAFPELKPRARAWCDILQRFHLQLKVRRISDVAPLLRFLANRGFRQTAQPYTRNNGDRVWTCKPINIVAEVVTDPADIPDDRAQRPCVRVRTGRTIEFSDTYEIICPEDERYDAAVRGDLVQAEGGAN